MQRETVGREVFSAIARETVECRPLRIKETRSASRFSICWERRYMAVLSGYAILYHNLMYLSSTNVHLSCESHKRPGGEARSLRKLSSCDVSPWAERRREKQPRLGQIAEQETASPP